MFLGIAKRALGPHETGVKAGRGQPLRQIITDVAIIVARRVQGRDADQRARCLDQIIAPLVNLCDKAMFQIAGHTPVPSLLIRTFTLGPCRGQVKMMAAPDLLGQRAFKTLADRLHNLAGGLDLRHVSDIRKKAKAGGRQIGRRHDAV